MATFGTAPNLQDMTALTNVALRKSTRVASDVDAAVLHQTAFSRGNTANLYLTVNAHFVVLPNGLILQLHPLTAYLWASNAFNGRGLAIEFVGNFSTEKGVYWQGDTYGRHVPTSDQINSGRDLLRYLQNTYDIGYVFAHRQGYATDARIAGNPPTQHSAYDNERSNCPGPDIWYGVGEWALTELKLSDGGKGYSEMDGDPIPDAWRKART
jgi:hypothetical protein